MEQTQLVRTDEGLVNVRILAREEKSDYRRVETASVKMHTNLKSAEGKRLFVRYFNSVQLATHFTSVIARTKLTHKDIQRIEDLVNGKLDAIDKELNRTIDSLELLFKNNGISRYATYDTMPLVLEVGVISAIGRRFFEMMHKFDETMPLFQTLDIFGVIPSREADLQRIALRGLIRKFVQSVRSLKSELQRRMNDLPSRAEAQVIARQRRNARPPVSMADVIVGPENGLSEARATASDSSASLDPEQCIETPSRHEPDLTTSQETTK
jgi:hypothetical protein